MNLDMVVFYSWIRANNHSLLLLRKIVRIFRKIHPVAMSRYRKSVDWVDLGPVVVVRVQDVGSGDSDVIIDAGYCDVVCVVLAGRYASGWVTGSAQIISTTRSPY